MASTDLKGLVSRIDNGTFSIENNETVFSVEDSLIPLRVGLLVSITDGKPKLGYEINEFGFFNFFKKNKVKKVTAKKILNNINDFIKVPRDYVNDEQIEALRHNLNGIIDYGRLLYVSWLSRANLDLRTISKTLQYVESEKFFTNPYNLVEIETIHFSKIDFFGKMFFVKEDDPIRYEALVCYILGVVCFMSGNLYLTPVQILGEIETLANKSDFLYTKKLSAKLIDRICERLSEKGLVEVDSTGAIYSNIAYQAENGSALHLSDTIETSELDIDVEAFISEFQKLKSVDVSFTLSEEQKDAIRMVAKERVCVITGLPGVGKSLITSAITEMYNKVGIRFRLFSPTGIAAKKLTQYTNEQAFTIHRGLGCRGKTWVHNESNPLDAGAVVVDESSMIDQFLFHRLLKALRDGTRIVLIGDYNQLPSVGPGNVFKELISCGKIPTTRMTTIFRQEEGSKLISNAHKINKGELVEASKKDFIIIKEPDQFKIQSKIVDLVGMLTEKGVDFQVITPTHKGLLGTRSLNRCIRDKINPWEKGKKFVDLGEGRSFRIGDKVMFTRNDYETDVFNGDMGIVKQISFTKRDDEYEPFITVEVEDIVPKVVILDEKKISDLALAYAITVHKSQGSEFGVVILPMVKAFSIQLERNLFYTAVTRAKKKLVILGDHGAIIKSIRTNRSTRRNTMLGDRLANLF